MAETNAELSLRLQHAVGPGFRERLLDKGLARGLIWRDGSVPEGSPSFPEDLSEDLLDYAHTVMALALRLRTSGEGAPQLLERAFLVVGEAIEAAVHRGERRIDQGFHRVTAAVAFHLGRYAARAFSMLPDAVDAQNLSPTEAALVELLRRRLDDLNERVSAWLLDPAYADDTIATKLKEDNAFDQADAIHTVLTSSFMRGLALFDHALTTGDSGLAGQARARLFATADAAHDLNAISHWWTATLAAHLIDELWSMSLHQQIPELPHDHDDHARWHEIRRGYIQRLRRGRRAAIDLWPSQLAAAKRVQNLTDDLVIALPTSAGKTRIAELCILRTLAAEKRAIYVTPLRALSAQIERDLAESLRPLGFSVSSLYGSAGIESGDEETLRKGRVVVSTPEKLDFALRNDLTLIDDVGLIVLDEGHMLGPNEREVRYEALVQRLVRRHDAAERRIICLSALFPTPEEMSNLVAWLRADEPGEPIHSVWRPTRQRFGVLSWRSGAARLDVKIEQERPFVPRFVEQTRPPKGSLRRRNFPADKNELTLAAAWRFIDQNKDVLIYCSEKRSVEPLGRLLLTCIRQQVLPSLGQPSQRVTDAMAVGAEWLGMDHPAVACLQHGVALHHGGLPRPFLNEVERLLRTGDCRLTIASPTLAQGLNLSASVLLVPSIQRNQATIPPAEFANVAGRAGRAFVDVEGLILHIIWEDTPHKTNYAVRRWKDLIAAAKAPQVASGILQLSINIFNHIAQKAGIEGDEVLEYVTNQDRAWDFDAARTEQIDEQDWNRNIASLDAAILALLDSETEDDDVKPKLHDVLEGSLFSRELARKEARVQTLLRSFVAARAHHIWNETTPAQRKGFHSAGIGLSAGKFIDAKLDQLMILLVLAEASIESENEVEAGKAIVEFAELVFQIAPFQAPKKLPTNWQQALLMWLTGQPSSEVLARCDGEGVALIQEALSYRLPWAMEAVRVHALAVQHEGADALGGLAALAVETGSSKRSVITLLRAGLSSREAATTAVGTTGASFTDRDGMRGWLNSELVQERSKEEDWPTKRSRPAWLQFYRSDWRVDRSKWQYKKKTLRVLWANSAPTPETPVVIVPKSGTTGEIRTPDLQFLGLLQTEIDQTYRDIVQAQVGTDGRVHAEFFGPMTDF